MGPLLKVARAAPEGGVSADAAIDSGGRDASIEEHEPATIDELITRCPSPDTLARIDADLHIRVEHGALAYENPIACTAEQSGRALTRATQRRESLHRRRTTQSQAATGSDRRVARRNPLRDSSARSNVQPYGCT
jgi:hypothetical protein